MDVELSAGLLSAHQGTLHFNVPAAAGSDVVLSVDVAGPFGRESSTRRIAIAAVRTRKPAAAAMPTAPRITEFAVATPVVRAGAKMNVTYATDARAGEVWLIDDTGRLWAHAPITSYGETTLLVPQAASGRQMRAVLHAQNQRRDALASVGLTVLPGIAPAPLSHTAAPPELSLSTQSPEPGEIVTVTLGGAHGDTRVTMTDGSGQSVDQGDIPSDQNAVTLTAPNVTKPTTYYVMASIREGAGDQTVVRKLLVAPR